MSEDFTRWLLWMCDPLKIKSFFEIATRNRSGDRFNRFQTTPRHDCYLTCATDGRTTPPELGDRFIWSPGPPNHTRSGTQEPVSRSQINQKSDFFLKKSWKNRKCYFSITPFYNIPATPLSPEIDRSASQIVENMLESLVGWCWIITLRYEIQWKVCFHEKRTFSFFGDFSVFFHYHWLGFGTEVRLCWIVSWIPRCVFERFETESIDFWAQGCSRDVIRRFYGKI